jgi:hypothetical protein
MKSCLLIFSLLHLFAIVPSLSKSISSCPSISMHIMTWTSLPLIYFLLLTALWWIHFRILSYLIQSPFLPAFFSLSPSFLPSLPLPHPILSLSLPSVFQSAVCHAKKIIPSQHLYSFLVNRFYDIADPGFAALADLHHSEVR